MVDWPTNYWLACEAQAKRPLLPGEPPLPLEGWMRDELGHWHDGSGQARPMLDNEPAAAECHMDRWARWRLQDGEDETFDEERTSDELSSALWDISRTPDQLAAAVREACEAMIGGSDG